MSFGQPRRGEGCKDFKERIGVSSLPKLSISQGSAEGVVVVVEVVEGFVKWSGSGEGCGESDAGLIKAS